MATLIANADALFTGAATWAVVDATALLDSEANSTAMTTAYVESAAFTPGAITIDGIAVKVAARTAAAGTISIRLAQAAATVVGTEVTINTSDIDSRAAEQGWYLFKFAAPVLLVVATAYTVSAKCSINGEITLYRNATAGNWSRMLRTTTAATAGAGDNLHIMGEWTAAATKTNRAVTMDSTAATDYCDANAANPPQFTINKGGTLTWGSTAATAYVLRLSGKLWIYSGGTMTMGTTGTPIPRDGSALLNFDCAADGDFGLVVHGTFTAQGLSRTAAKIFTKCLLNTDEAAGQTTLGVDTDTGWLSGDEVGIAPTTRTVNQNETRVLNGAAGASSFAVTAGLTNAHSGTSPTQADVILLTRNVRVESVSTTAMSYCLFGPAGIVDCDWVSFRYMGANVTGKRGVEVTTESGGSMTMDYCSIRNFERFGVYVTGVNAANFYMRNCVGYLAGGQTGTDSAFAVFTAVTSTAWEVSDCVNISGNNSGGAGFYFESLTGVVQRIKSSACSSAIIVDLSDGRIVGTCSDWTGYSCTNGIQFIDVCGGRVNNLTAWRMNSSTQQGGISFTSMSGNVVLDGITAFGNGNSNIVFTNSFSMYGPITFRDAVLAGDSTFSTASGFAYGAVTGGQQGHPVIFENCTMGVAAGIHVAHSTADIQFQANSPTFKNIVLIDTLLASTETANSTALWGRSAIGYQKKDQTAGVHQTFYPALGTIDYETSVFHTAAPSEKLTPSGATAALRLRSQIRRFPVSSGEVLAVSVWVRKSSLYTGSAARLLQLSNAAIGLDDDVVLDSAAAAADTWEQLTGSVAAATADGVIEVVIEVDGSAGIVYVDDWAAAVA